jgi:hypothetical protein
VLRFAIKLVLFLAVIISILKLLDVYYTNYNLSHKNLCEKSDWVLQHQNETFDFAFIGNSRVINMVDVDTIEKKTGKKGINLGLTGANYAENYLLLYQFLKQGNRVKTLAIQVDMHSLKSTTLPYPFHNYNYMQFFNDSIVRGIYRDNNPWYKFAIWKYIPFTRYMEFSSKFVLYKMIKGGFECGESLVFGPAKGTEFLYPKNFTPPANSYAYWSVNKLDEKYLNKLIRFAKQQDIRVAFYTAPIYHSYLPYQLRLKNVLEQANILAKQNDIPYFNLCEGNDLCYDIRNFNDNIHMNKGGVQKFSAMIADSLKPYLN